MEGGIDIDGRGEREEYKDREREGEVVRERHGREEGGEREGEREGDRHRM